MTCKDPRKPQFALIPPAALHDLARVYTFGAGKYAPHGWRVGLDWSCVYSALQRHLNAFWRGEELDAESGLPHLAHAAWGCLTLMEYSRTQTGHDSRQEDQDD